MILAVADLMAEREGFKLHISNPLADIDFFRDFDYKINGLIVDCRSCWSPLVRHVPRQSTTQTGLETGLLTGLPATL